MKRDLTSLGLLILLALIIPACAPTAAATDIPEQEVTANQPVVATETSALESPTSAPTLIPTTGPSMEVGSVVPYIDGSNLVAVPAGEFTMGGKGTDNPEHPVIISDYWVYSTKVTNQQYALCVSLGKCTPPDPDDNPGYSDHQRANNPVTGVTYNQAATYCGFVQGRLPTEAEWEKAARDPQGGNYPWGDTTPTCELANFDNCANGTTSVVNYSNGGSYYGALDMAGNAFEWTADWYDANYYQNSPAENPPGPESGTVRVVRSSGYDSKPEQVAITNRNSEDPQNHRANLGFRCVVDEPTYFAPLCESPLVYGQNVSGGTAQEVGTSTCPSLDLVQVKYCNGKFPATNVTVNGSPDPTIDSEGCISIDNPPNTLVCQPPSVVSARANCQVEISGDSACPTGYSVQDNTCTADGGQGTCLDGMNYDPSKQCCGLSSGSDASLNASVCPVGTYHIASQNACLPNPVQELVTVSLDVEFKSCVSSGGGGGGGEDNSCAPQACPGTSWSPTLCCCTLYFDPNTCQ